MPYEDPRGGSIQIQGNRILNSSSYASLMSPRSVAVVGASQRSEWLGGRLLRNMVQIGHGSDRRLYAINPNHQGADLHGCPVFPSVAALPEPVDVVVIASPARTVRGVLDDAAVRGVGAVIVTSAVRSKSHEDSRAFDRAIRAWSERSRIPVIGPNSLGVLNGNAGFSGSLASGADYGLRAGGMSVISQSGAVLSYLLQRSVENGTGFAHLISTGNEATVDLTEVVGFAVEDPGTRSVLLFVEGVRDGLGLRTALLRARELAKPVAVVKVGQSAAGAAAAMSHTGRLTGEDEFYRSAFREAHAVSFNSYQEFFDFGYVAERGEGLARGRRAAIVANSGGMCILASDQLLASGWSLPPLPAKTAQEVGVLTGADDAANPLDLPGIFGTDLARLPKVVSVLARSGEFDQIFVLLGAGGERGADVSRLVAEETRTLSCGLSIAWIGIPARAKAALEEAGVVVFDDPSRAIRSVTTYLNGRPSEGERAAARQLGTLIGAKRSRGDQERRARSIGKARRTVGAAELLNLLGLEGMAVAPWRLLRTNAPDDELMAAAGDIGYPVIMKLDGDGFVHKTELGAVSPFVLDDVALLKERERLAAIAGRQGHAALLLVQKAIRGVEILIGAKWDPCFGHLLAVGPGGTLAELIADVSHILLPTTPGRLRDALAELPRLSALLRGYRGGPPCDEEALFGLLWQVCGYLESRGEAVQEMDLNPVIVSGTGASIVDGRALTT